MVLTTFDQENHDRILKKDSYDRGYDKGNKQGIKEGKKEGIKQNQKLVICNMRQQGFSDDIIEKALGVKLDELT